MTFGLFVGVQEWLRDDGRSGVKLGTKRSISAKLDAMTEVALHGVQGWDQANVFHEWVFHRC